MGNFFQSIGTTTWAGNLAVPGGILLDEDCIKQRVYLAISTPLGSDPLRPYFGTNINRWNDRPTNTVPALVKNEIIRALQLWVPEVKVVSISYKIVEASVTYAITINWNGKNIPVEISAGGGCIASVALPYLRSGVFWLPVVTINGSTIPFESYANNIPDLLEMMTVSFSDYGTWGALMKGNKGVLVLYGNETVRTASIEIILG